MKRSDHSSVLVAKNSQFATQDESVQHQVLKAQRNNQVLCSIGNQASSSTGNQASTSAGNQCTIQPSSHRAPVSIEIESCYAVDYVNRYYIGRAIHKSEVFVTFKYIHAIGTKFYWPGKDDLEAVLSFYDFFGPIALSGTGPFTIENQSEVDKAWLLIKGK